MKHLYQSDLKAMKTGWMPSPNGLPSELSKNGTNLLLEHLGYVFSWCLKSEELHWTPSVNVCIANPVSYTHLDVYKRQALGLKHFYVD